MESQLAFGYEFLPRTKAKGESLQHHEKLRPTTPMLKHIPSSDTVNQIGGFFPLAN
jgi:hypothetical protein